MEVTHYVNRQKNTYFIAQTMITGTRGIDLLDCRQIIL